MAADGMTKRLFLIGGPGGERAVGSARLMGFKAHNLARMAAIGLPVPQAFVLGTGYSAMFSTANQGSHEELQALLGTHVRWLEQVTGLTYSGSRKPLLVSVRSGAPVAMPGMMDTILNVGLTDTSLRGFLRMTGNPRLVWDSYRRLIQSFAETVYGAESEAFDVKLAECLKRASALEVQELDSRSLAALTRDYLALHRKLTGRDFPQEPMSQLQQAVTAVFRSWNGTRATEYRRARRIDSALGTAVTVQRMVFGNAGGTSGSGVAFTRNPATGENGSYMDFLFNAQGKDVVSGRCRVHDSNGLSIALPQVHRELAAIGRGLESEFKDMQEFEFTIQEGALFLLQTRTGKRSALAALRIAVEQVREGLISRGEGLKRLESVDLDRIVETRCSDEAELSVLCSATPASIGVVSGAIALDADQAIQMTESGKSVILVREEASTFDIAGISVAVGLLTALGGRTSHAAVVARQLDKVCLVGCTGLEVDLKSRTCVIGGRRLSEGDTLGLDSTNGLVFTGTPRTTAERPIEYLQEISTWRNRAKAAVLT